VLMIASNVLATKNALGGKANKQISDEHPTYMTPDGKTFAVWGIIYSLLAVTVVAQAFPSARAEEALGRRCPLTGLGVRPRLALAFLANGAWLPVWTFERFWLGLGIMAAYLALLLSLYGDVGAGAAGGICERVALAAGIAANTSWIVVALSVNTFLCGGLAGWRNEHGVAGSVPAAAIVCVFAAAVACERAIVACDMAWAFVAAWALQGICRMQTVPDKARFPISAMSPTLGKLAQGCSIIVVVAMLGGAGLALRQGVKAAS